MLVCVTGNEKGNEMRVRGRFGVSGRVEICDEISETNGPKQGTLAGGPRLSGVLAVSALV